MKEIKLLSKGLFNKKFMDSKVKTRAVSKKERILGHLIGPLGLIFVVNTIAALVEKFFTQQVGLIAARLGSEADQLAFTQSMGRKYELVMTIAKILGIAISLLNGFLRQRTQCRQGRLRPWYLIYGFISVGVGFLIFLFSPNVIGESYWYFFFMMLILYNTVGNSYFYFFRDNIVSVSTRDPEEKSQLNFIRKVSWTLISGIVIGMVLSSVVLPMWLEKDINGYPILGVILSVIAIPLVLMEYFFTKERVIEDVAEEVGIEKENNIPLKMQIKALVTNKYWLIMFILVALSSIVDNFKGGNVQYFYIKFMLGGKTNYGMYTIYQIATGIPTGLGAIFAYPLSKKIGVKNMTWFGYLLVLGGSILGWVFPDNVPVAMTAGFIRNVGMIPNAYVLALLTYYAFDSIEYKSGFRLEGLLGVAIFSMLQTAACAPFAGGYESILLKLGFIDNSAYVASPQVKEFMTLAFYLFDIILASVYLILIPFVDVEKKMPVINKTLTWRRREAVLARGMDWIDPEVQRAREREQAKIEREENRIADLKEKCRKKGLDFDTENNKYLAQKAEAEKKKQAKKIKAEEAKKKRASIDAIVEETRVAELKRYCELNGLDFEDENNKFLAKLSEWEDVKKAREERAISDLANWEKKQDQSYERFQLELYEENVRQEIKTIEKKRKAEERRIAKLKTYCQKNNLDFDAENRKYLDEQSKQEVAKKQAEDKSE